MIAWVDTETTGLEPKDGHLLEVALVITGDNLDEIAALDTVIKPVGVDIEHVTMDPFVLKMHTDNGLLEEIKRNGLRRHEAEGMLNRFLSCYTAKIDGTHEKLVLAGSTVGFDRAWLKQHMSELESMFNYRSIDVSSLTELAKRWAPKIYEKRPQGSAHRAMSDILASIEILKYYRAAGFIGNPKGDSNDIPRQDQET